MLRFRQALAMLVVGLVAAIIGLVVWNYSGLWQYVAIVNFFVAVGYYNIIILIWLSPLKVKWLRQLGLTGVIFAAELTGFFLGCGNHHMEMVVQNLTAYLYGVHEHDQGRMAVWDTLQVISALAAAYTLITRGPAMIDRLREADGHSKE